jgi:hypothetical protein
MKRKTRPPSRYIKNKGELLWELQKKRPPSLI